MFFKIVFSIEYTTSIDMWGVGCIYYEMVSGKPLFPGSTPDDQLEKIFKILGSPTEATWPGLMKIHTHMLILTF